MIIGALKKALSIHSPSKEWVDVPYHKPSLKIFISQPMRGRTNQEINDERKAIIERCRNRYGDIEAIGWVHDMVSPSAIWCLGRSIQILSNADVAVFAEGWESARGCRIEHQVCEEYGIETYDL